MHASDHLLHRVTTSDEATSVTKLTDSPPMLAMVQALAENRCARLRGGTLKAVETQPYKNRNGRGEQRFSGYPGLRKNTLDKKTNRATRSYSFVS